jgi:hypothetical protein
MFSPVMNTGHLYGPDRGEMCLCYRSNGVGNIIMIDVIKCNGQGI